MYNFLGSRKSCIEQLYFTFHFNLTNMLWNVELYIIVFYLRFSFQSSFTTRFIQSVFNDFTFFFFFFFIFKWTEREDVFTDRNYCGDRNYGVNSSSKTTLVINTFDNGRYLWFTLTRLSTVPELDISNSYLWP